MKPAPKTKRMTAAEQSALFKKTARELGANESSEAFDKLLKHAAKPAKKR